MVGAGVPGEGTGGTPRSRMADSNYGSRVDCQGWGMKVKSTSVDYDGNDTLGVYGEHSETSGASAMVAGVAACLQSTHFATFGSYMSPGELQQALRSNENNTDQTQATGMPSPSEQRIGPLPNLDSLLTDLCIDPPCGDIP